MAFVADFDHCLSNGCHACILTGEGVQQPRPRGRDRARLYVPREHGARGGNPAAQGRHPGGPERGTREGLGDQPTPGMKFEIYH
eukprot:scaffold127179_cov38-Prasinocladus_malaysianus.AAC.1